MSSAKTTPVPVPRPETVKFWEGCKEGEFRLQKCDDCGKVIFYPRAICTGCMSHNLSWIKSSGQGEVYTYSIHYRGATPAFQTPYVVALVDLAEGVRVMTNIVGCDVNDVKIGMKVKVIFEPLTEEISLPKFQPA
ncbi:MAG: Zn-ribbon domain-containing OB-fold protein [Thermincolia bacterium]